MTCDPILYGKALGSNSTSSRSAPEHRTAKELWETRIARSRAAVEKHVKLTSSIGSDCSHGYSDLAAAWEGLGVWKADLIRMEAEGRANGWLASDVRTVHHVIDDPADAEVIHEEARRHIAAWFRMSFGSKPNQIRFIDCAGGSKLAVAHFTMDQFKACYPTPEHAKECADAAEAEIANYNRLYADALNYGVGFNKITADPETGEIKREYVTPEQVYAAGVKDE